MSWSWSGSAMCGIAAGLAGECNRAAVTRAAVTFGLFGAAAAESAALSRPASPPMPTITKDRTKVVSDMARVPNIAFTCIRLFIGKLRLAGASLRLGIGSKSAPAEKGENRRNDRCYRQTLPSTLDSPTRMRASAYEVPRVRVGLP